MKFVKIKFLIVLVVGLCIYFKLFKLENYEYSSLSKIEIKNFKRFNSRYDLAIDSTSTYPFVSGSNFVFISDYVYDFRVKNIEPIDKLKDGDILFVNTEFIDDFFSHVSMKIKTKFILITHNSDYLLTNEKHLGYLNDNNNLLAWFGHNPRFEHSKFIPIPIGIENTIYFPNKIKIIRNITNLIAWNQRKYLLYLNYDSSKNVSYKLFENFENTLIIENKVNYSTYLNHIGNSKYVLCPSRGNGLDTHQFYETILMGSIPIVEHSLLDSLYLKTTSLIVNNYSDLTIDILKQPEKYIKNMNFSRDILYLETWLNEIKKYKPDLNLDNLIK